MVSAGVAAVGSALVLGVVVTLARLNTATGNYFDMSTQNRQALSVFEGDMRMLAGAQTLDGTRLSATLVELDATGTLVSPLPTVTYRLVNGNLYRDYTNTAGVSRTTTVLTGVANTRVFTYFDAIDNTGAVTSANLRKILLSANLRRTSGGGSETMENTDYVVSAVVVVRRNPVN